ncbi:MAG: hypothetical protein HY925_09785 [Elusimicrobia bacterium]|nr:hypothetical protein [Elusimicrobiota bacterium]
MIRLTAAAAALLLAFPAYAAKKKPAKAGAVRQATADGAYSIEWPIPASAHSASPPGMKHLFFLSTADKGLAVDVAAATPKMTPESYFEIAGTGSPSKPETARLADKSSFTWRRTTEAQGGKTQYFTQGVLVKKDGRFYVTITSPLRHPEKKEWSAILGALASLRAGGGTPPKSETVVNVGADGSTLRLVSPWENQSWGYTKRLGTPLHSFKRGPLKCELATLGLSKGSPKDLAAGLRNRYYESSGRKPGPNESVPASKKLKNGIELHYFEIGLPARDDDARKQFLLEGFFSRGGELYYFLAAAAQDDLPQKAFEKAAGESLDVLGSISFRK